MVRDETKEGARKIDRRHPRANINDSARGISRVTQIGKEGDSERGKREVTKKKCAECAGLQSVKIEGEESSPKKKKMPNKRVETIQ